MSKNLSTNSLVKTRFAPSPTGLMHFGNLRVALFNYLYAKKQGGQFLLRIEDTDLARSEDHFQAAILSDLAWMGLNYDEGPLYQSKRQKIYEEQYEKLQELNLIYPCFCTEEQLALNRKVQLSQGKPPRYTGACGRLSGDEIEAKKKAGIPYTLRFRVPLGDTVVFEDLIKGKQQFDTDHIGDFIIRRGDASASFMFCNAIDDALMGVTHALRGDDHLTNTPRQILILKALNLSIPQYGHFPTILGPDSRPLSKRNGSRSIQELRQEGYLPLGILNYLARLGHYEPDPQFENLANLAEHFDLDRINLSAAHFDNQQLNYWQKEAMHHCDPKICWDIIKSDVETLVPPDLQPDFIKAVQPNILMPLEAKKWAEIIFADVLEYNDEAVDTMLQAGLDFYEAALKWLNEKNSDNSYANNASDTSDTKASFTAGFPYSEFTKALQEKTGLKGKALFFPLRLALTSEYHGPELKQLLDLMGMPMIIKRFLAAHKRVEKEIEKKLKHCSDQ